MFFYKVNPDGSLKYLAPPPLYEAGEYKIIIEAGKRTGAYELYYVPGEVNLQVYIINVHKNNNIKKLECEMHQLPIIKYNKMKKNTNKNEEYIFLTKWSGDEIAVDINGDGNFIDFENCKPANGPIILNRKSVIITGMGSCALIDFAERGSVTVHNMSNFSIEDYIITQGGITAKTFMPEGDIRVDFNEDDRNFKEVDFSISTPTCIAGVRGTIFHVSHRHETNATKVCVDRGKVEVTPKMFSDKPKMVKSGECITVDSHSFGTVTKPSYSLNNNGLIAYYPLNGDTEDYSGYRNHGVNHGAIFSSGFSGKALKFNGTDAYLEIPRRIKDDFTIEAWVKSDSQSLTGTQCYQGNGLIWSDVGGTNNDFILALLNNKFCMFTGNPDKSILSSTTVTKGGWMHVAVTRERKTGKVRMYVNGKEEASMFAGRNALNANPQIHIGGNTLDRRFFKGFIDEVRIYNFARTSEEISSDFNKTKSYIPTSNLSTGQYVVIHPDNNISFTFKNRYKFKGYDDYITISKNSISDLKKGQALSISLWFKASDLRGVRYSTDKWGEGWRTILSKDNGYSGSCFPGNPFYKNAGYILRIINDKIQFSLRNNNYKNNYADLYSPNIYPNKWYNVVVAVSAVPGNGFAKMYLNGREVDSKVISNPTDYIDGRNLYLGATFYDRTCCKSPKYYDYVNGSSGMSQFFKGEIANVQLYDRILSPQEILNFYMKQRNLLDISNIHKTKDIGNLNSDKINNTDINGIWKWFNGEIVWIYKNGTCRSSEGNKDGWSVIRFNSIPTYRIVWESGAVDLLELHNDTLEGFNQGGTHIWGKRIK
ncbi:LamG-like jellyroll fold domain-containing protein [Deferribacter desulfuricans]|nr:LamG-like jellyroll fold domain-containing protein [Deferribacter desulfuricans]